MTDGSDEVEFLDESAGGLFEYEDDFTRTTGDLGSTTCSRKATPFSRRPSFRPRTRAADQPQDRENDEVVGNEEGDGFGNHEGCALQRV